MPRAKRQDPTKSDAIREILQANPSMSANDVVATLKAKGVSVTANLVYFIKGKLKVTKQRKTRIVKAAKAAASSNGAADPIALIRDVRALSLRAGGYEKLKELVSALAD